MKFTYLRRVFFCKTWLGFFLSATLVLTGGVGECRASDSSDGEVGIELSSADRNGKQLLTLQKAFEMGLQNSSAIKRVRFQPLQAAEEYNKAKTIYDPALFSVGTTERTDRPVQSQLDGVPFDSALNEDRWKIQAGIKERLPTGGSIAIYQEGGRYDTNDRYSIPNPQYQSRVAATFSQPLLKGLGDKEGATAIQVAEFNLQIAESAFKRDVADILLEISNHYWQLYYEQSVVRITGNSLARAQTVYDREKVREKQGLSMPIDVDRALVATKTRRSSLLRAINQERLSVRKLWMLLAPERLVENTDLPDLEVQGLAKMEFESLERKYLRDEARKLRQEMAIARDTVAISEQHDSLAEHNQLPQLDLKLSYGLIGLEEAQDNLAGDPYNDEYYDWQVELAFEWPIGGRSAKAEKRRTFYQLQQSRAEVRLAEERVTQEVDLILDELILAEEELQVTEMAVKAAYRVLKGEESMFELGKKNNQDLLEIQDYYGAAEKEYLRAQARYSMNLVSLARARGSLLDNYGLAVDTQPASFQGAQ